MAVEVNLGDTDRNLLKYRAEPVFALAERLFRGEFEMMMFLTGIGVRQLNRLLASRYGETAFADALRRTLAPEDAADVVSETFLTAWRRLDDMPSDDESLLWLYGVAHRVRFHAGDFAVKRINVRDARRGIREMHRRGIATRLEIEMRVRRRRTVEHERLQIACWSAGGI